MRDYVKESEYPRRMRENVVPCLAAARRPFSFAGKDGRVLSGAGFSAAEPKGTVFLLHGLNEFTEKYRELIYTFLSAGLSVLTFDARGHGASAQAEEKEKILLSHFRDYVDDAQTAAERLSEYPAPYYLYGHSMGGAVGALLLERMPEFFRGAVLSSPMIELRGTPGKRAALSAVCALMRALGKGGKTVAERREKERGGKDASAPTSLSGVRKAAVAEARKELGFPHLPVTYGWTGEALRVCRKILAKGKPESIRTPVLLFSAARDALVGERAQREFACRVPHGTFLSANAEHAVYLSSDEVLFPYLDTILDFFGG